MSAKCVGLTSPDMAYTNCIYISSRDYQSLLQQYRSEPVLLQINNFVFTVLPDPALLEGIALNKLQRDITRLSLVDTFSPRLFAPPDDFFLGTAKFEVEMISRRAKALEINEEELEKVMKEKYSNFVLNQGQTILIDYKGAPLQLKVGKLTLIELTQQPTKDEKLCDKGFLNAHTVLSFDSVSASTLTIISNRLRTMNIFEGPRFNFEELGIGGLDEEFSMIFRRAFASRLFPPIVMKRLGINHVKGMLLFGPPGTGKTLIARQIAKCLKAHEPKIINGPEVFNKYVGQTEENIRELFKDAENEQNEKGEKSKLHIIIFDEIDAICKPRGTISGGTGVHDTAVNQLLSKIDGVNALNNILVIGMTNRKDMIDEAVLRPGRLEVHVEVGLPNEDGRQQILRIHTKKMVESGALADDVDLLELAHRTKNFSGAEIEALVKSAASFAFNKHIDLDNLGQDLKIEDIKIGMQDFLHALDEIRPMFGVDNEDLQRYIRNGIVDYGDRFRQIYNTCHTLIKQVKNSPQTPLLSLLLEGPSGTGKTALAAKLALESEFPYIKLISPENFVGYTENGKIQAINKQFEDAYRSPLSVIVLDNIERLIEYVSTGPRFSNAVLQAILVLAKKIPPRNDRRLLIIGTTSNAAFLEDLELVKSFNVVIEVQKLDPEAVQKVLLKYKVPKDHAKLVRENLTAPVALKQVLLALEMAQQYSNPVTAEAFLECLSSISL